MVGSAPLFGGSQRRRPVLERMRCQGVVAQWLPRGLALIFTPRSSSSNTNPERPDSIWHWLQSRSILSRPPRAERSAGRLPYFPHLLLVGSTRVQIRLKRVSRDCDDREPAGTRTSRTDR